MAIDFSKPTVTSDYQDVPTILRDHFIAIACGLTGTLANTPTGARRVNAGVAKFEVYSGAAWTDWTLAIDGGGTGAKTADTALNNLGGTTLGKTLFKVASTAAARTALELGSAATMASTAFAAASHGHAIADVTSLQTSLDAKAPTSRTLTAGTGLSGGGNLTADRTFALADMTQATIKGRAAGAGTGAPADLSGTQVTAILPDATDTARGVLETATAGEVRAGATDKILTPGAALSALAEVALTDAATVTWDGANAINATLATSSNRTLANITNAKVGQVYSLRLTGTGSISAWGNIYDFPDGSAPAGIAGVYDIEIRTASIYLVTVAGEAFA